MSDEHLQVIIERFKVDLELLVENQHVFCAIRFNEDELKQILFFLNELLALRRTFK